MKFGNQMIKKNLNFFIGLLLIFIISKFLFIDRNLEKSDYLTLKATFNNVDGLLNGTDVRMSGIKIGDVFKIHLEKNKPVIYLAIEKKRLIPDDSSLSIQTDGLFGSKFLSLEPGGTNNYLKNNDEIIFTEDSLLVQDLLRKIINLGETKKGNL